MDLVEVWKGWGEAEARCVQGFLAAHGIPSALRGESTRLTHGFTLTRLATVRILVRDEDVSLARRLISETETEKPPDSSVVP